MKARNSKRRSIINTIRDKRAFTLSEALIATLIMLLVSGIMVAGIPSAINAYNDVVMVSNSEVLLSTTMSTLRNELGTATEVEQASDESGSYITYYNQAFGTVSKISRSLGSSSEPKGTIMYQRYASETEFDDIYTGSDGVSSDGVNKTVRLISEEASDKDKNLYTTYDRVVYKSDGVITFYNLRACKDDKTLTSIETYSIRTFPNS